MKCPQLGDPPDPRDIIDVFSPVLGDPFHAMDRPKVSIRQDLKKSYYVVFMNAWLIWDDNLMNELRTRMAETGLSEEDIDAELFYNPSLFKGSVDRHVPPPSILYWRVRAVFVTFGNMVDESTGRPLFNAAAWKRAKNLLTEIRAGLYSDPPGMKMYTYKMEKGRIKLNKYGMKMIECMRGTNRQVKRKKSILLHLPTHRFRQN